MGDRFDVNQTEFIHEIRDIVEKVRDDLLTAQGDLGTPTGFNSVYRGVHTVRVSSGFYGMIELEVMSRALEHILEAMRLGRLGRGPEVLHLVVEGTDALSDIVEAWGCGEKPPCCRELLGRIAECSKAPVGNAASLGSASGPGAGRDMG